MDVTITIKCENLTQEGIDELYYQLSIKMESYGAIMNKHINTMNPISHLPFIIKEVNNE